MLRVVVAVDDDLSKSIVHMGVMAALTDQVLQEWIQQLQPAQSRSMNVEADCTSTLSQLKCSDTNDCRSLHPAQKPVCTCV